MSPIKNKIRRHGFTMLEIIVALTIVLIIFSVVYGTYFAVTRSADRCSDKITLSFQARSFLNKLSYQLRSAYLTQDRLDSSENPSVLSVPDNTPRYFAGYRQPRDGIILHFLTTGGLFRSQLAPQGPFEVAYRYDPSLSCLYYCQQIYVPQSLPGNNSKLSITTQAPNWFPIAENITGLELAFYDGNQWHDHWLDREKNNLPQAVKVVITLQGNNASSEIYSTIIYFPCSQNNSALHNLSPEK